MSAAPEHRDGRTPAECVVEALGLADSARKLDARDAFDVVAEDRAWAVMEGLVDVFFVPPGVDGTPRGGRRRFVVRIEAGSFLLSFNPGRSAARALGDVGLLAVPASGTTLVELRRSDLSRTLEGDDRAALAAEIARQVVDRLRDFRRGEPLPIVSRGLSAGERVRLTAGQLVTAREGLVWLRTAEGLFSPGVAPGPDLPTYPLPDHCSAVPVSDDGWWRVEKDCEVEVLSHADWVAGADAVADVGSLRQFVILLGLALDRREDRRDRETATEWVRRTQLAFENAVGRLADAIERRSRLRSDASQTPLARALEVVCRREGAELGLAEGESLELGHAADPIGALLRRSSVVARPVDLVGRWWESSQGALLGFVGPERAPRALLPRPGRRGYLVFDPVEDTSEPVDEQLAQAIAPDGWAVLRPFGPEVGRVSQMLSFATLGAGRDVVTIVLMILAAALLGLVPPIVSGEILGPVASEARLDELGTLLALLLVAGGGVVSFSFVQAIAALRLEGRMGNSVQTAVWLRLLELPVSFFQRYSVGDLTNRADGIDQLRSMVTSSVTRTLLHSVTGLFSFALMLYYDWKIGLVLGILVGLYLLGVLPAAWVYLRVQRVLQNLVGRIQGVVFQLLGAIAKLRVAGSERAAFLQWSERFSRAVQLIYRARLVDAGLSVTQTVLRSLALATILVVVGWQGNVLWDLFVTPAHLAEIDRAQLQQILPVSDFVSFNVAMGQFLAAVFGFSRTVVNLLAGVPLVERVQPILAATPERSPAAGTKIRSVSGDVVFREVYYRYQADGPFTLNGLTFQAVPGEMVALVGPSGAGKSTALRLLLGFDEPEAGSVFIDDHDLRVLDKQSIRGQMGVVLQNGRLLAGTILENIASGTDLSEDDAWELLRMTGLEEDVRALPMGLRTYVAEGATNFSGGQKQRMLVARAIAHKPRLLLFDEATSALDNETQRQVSTSLEQLSITRIVIAHRLSTIAAADRIYYIEEGRVLESGTYDELMAADGAFAAQARRQII